MSLGVVHFCPVILYKMGLQSKCEVADGWKRERSVPARPCPARPRSAQAIRRHEQSLAWRPLPPCGCGWGLGGWGLEKHCFPAKEIANSIRRCGA